MHLYNILADAGGQPQIFDFQLRGQVPPANGSCPSAVCADATQIAGCADQLTQKTGGTNN